MQKKSPGGKMGTRLGTYCIILTAFSNFFVVYRASWYKLTFNALKVCSHHFQWY